MEQDQIFQFETPVAKDFEFDQKVAQVFDDMIGRSVPGYQEARDLTVDLVEFYFRPGQTVVDLGCSTGSLLLHLYRRLKDQFPHLVGVDSSSAMIERARQKFDQLAGKTKIEWHCQLAENYAIPDSAAAVVAQYLLQFLRPLAREEFLRALYEKMPAGSVLLLSEKTISSDRVLNRTWIEMHHRQKLANGYTELEVAKKREALENVLIPFSDQENIQLLKKVGFSHVEVFFKRFNFSSYCAVKSQ